MCDHPTIKPLALSDHLDFENLDDYEATSAAPACISMGSSTASKCYNNIGGCSCPYTKDFK